MNGARRVITVVATVNIVVMLLVPPCDSLMLGRGALPTFDAYYPIFDTHPRRYINTDLLFIQIAWVLVNYLAALLFWAPDRRGAGLRALLAWGLCNAGLMLLFPPFENYSSASRVVATHFEGFHFVFGDRAQRPVYLPLLYLELIVLALNGAVLWLAMGRARPAR